MKRQVYYNPFGGIDEQAMTDQLEAEVGIQRGFRLRDCFVAASQAISGDRCSIHKPKRNLNDVFRSIAKRRGFSSEEIEAYLHYNKYV